MKKLVSVILSLISVTVCFAQVPDPFDLHIADFRLLVSKRVQADVGLTKSEIAQLNVYADQNRAKIKAYQDQLKRAGRDPNRIPNNDKTLIAYFVELQEQVLTHLNPKELRRLRELTLQSVGLRGMLDANVAKRLGLTDVQLQKARLIFERGAHTNDKISSDTYAKVIEPYRNERPRSQAEAKAISDKVKGLYDAAMAKKAPEIRKLAEQTRKQFESVVSPKQLAAYRALGGKLFVPK